MKFRWAGTPACSPGGNHDKTPSTIKPLGIAMKVGLTSFAARELKKRAGTSQLRAGIQSCSNESSMPSSSHRTTTRKPYKKGALTGDRHPVCCLWPWLNTPPTPPLSFVRLPLESLTGPSSRNVARPSVSANAWWSCTSRDARPDTWRARLASAAPRC